jgi:TPR repeat protein
VGEVKPIQKKSSDDWFEAVISAHADGIGVNNMGRDRFNEVFEAFMARSYDTAYAGFVELAEAGSSVCQYYLGLMHLEGKGALQDFGLAHKWLNIASSRGHDKARKQLDNMTQRMSAEHVAEAQKEARLWVASHSGDNDHAQ